MLNSYEYCLMVRDFGESTGIAKVISSLEHISLHEELDERDNVVSGSVALSDLLGLREGEGVLVFLYPFLQDAVHQDMVVDEDRVIGGGGYKGHDSRAVKRYLGSSFEIPHPNQHVNL